MPVAVGSSPPGVAYPTAVCKRGPLRGPLFAFLGRVSWDSSPPVATPNATCPALAPGATHLAIDRQAPPPVCSTGSKTSSPGLHVRYSAMGNSVEERYERNEEIGSGGIGTVYRGTHRALGRPVAIKEIKDLFGYIGDARKSDTIEKFANSVRQHAGLVHPSIVQILDLNIQGDYPYFVMEYAPNGSLRNLLDGDRPDLSVLMTHFVSIAQALRFAHSRGVVHADIKPENVVFDADGHAKLVDFAVSRIIEADTREQQIYIAVGTRAYKSPEQFVNPVGADARSDIYSLGIMFYEMLTGKLPGRRSPLPSSLYPEIPRKLDEVFDNMCMDSPEDRYASMDELLEDLLRDESITALLGTPVRPPAAPAPQEPAPEEPAQEEAPEEEPEAMAEEADESADDAEDTDDADASASSSQESAASSSILDKLDKYNDQF